MFEDLRPVEARVAVDGPAGAAVRMVTSTKFVAGVDERGITRVSVLSSDTTFPTLPVNVTHHIGEDRRFLVEISRLDADLSSIRVRAFVNSEQKFDERGPLAAAGPYRFVYVFNQLLTPTIELVF